MCFVFTVFTLHEVTLNEAIRYADGDSIEAWLNKLFCLDTEVTYLSGSAPDPKHCQLYPFAKCIIECFIKENIKLKQN